MLIVEGSPADAVRRADLRALKTFAADYPECERILVYRGHERLRVDGIWCIPGQEFLQRLIPSRGLIE